MTTPGGKPSGSEAPLVERHPPPTLSLQWATRSEAGPRGTNQDRVVTSVLPEGRALMAVADGMGGHASGEVASALALETLEVALREGATLEEAVVRSNKAVHAESQADSGRKGMGTTLVAMLLDHGEYWIANVGDSRAYRLGLGRIEQLSTDHSFVAEAVRRGESEEDAKESYWKDALTRSIGVEEDTKVDLFGPFEFAEGMGVMLCSDGLYKVLADDELLSLYADQKDPDHAVDELIRRGQDAGSDDDITVAIARPNGRGTANAVLDSPVLAAGAAEGPTALANGAPRRTMYVLFALVALLLVIALLITAG